jgi:hypothetical protein
MRKIQFDVINGFYEVKNFDNNSIFVGFFDKKCFSRKIYIYCCKHFNNTYAVEVSEDIYEVIDNEYGIVSL